MTIPNSVTSIGERAFEDCWKLGTIYVQCEVPIECDPRFSDNVLKEAILYVPTGTLSAYEKVDPWRNFWNIEETDFSGVTIVPMDNSSQMQLSVESGILTINGLDTGELPSPSTTCRDVWSTAAQAIQFPILPPASTSSAPPASPQNSPSDLQIRNSNSSSAIALRVMALLALWRFRGGRSFRLCRWGGRRQ